MARPLRCVIIFNFRQLHIIYKLSMQVRLIGYCVEGSLFLVYEFIENGNLSQHLRGSSGEIICAW